MLEFYTEEFKKRANGQINELNDMFKYLLPKLEKWQMKGCMVLGKDLTTYYVPIRDENDNQIGTKITIFNKITGETYLIVSLEESLKYRKTSVDGEIETYKLYLENNKLCLETIFVFNNDYIIYREVENEDVKISSNSEIDLKGLKEELLKIEDVNKMPLIKNMYFNNKKSLSRTRKKGITSLD